MTSTSVVSGERQERDHASALDGEGELALMFGANARHAARRNLPAIADEVAQHRRVFVVDDDSAIVAERATTTPGPAKSFALALADIGAPYGISSGVHSSSSSSLKSSLKSSSIERAASVRGPCTRPSSCS